MNAKRKMEILMEHFGPCRCDNHCQVEQFSDESMQDKPGGRYSVCEIEADKHGIQVPPREEE